MIIKRIKLPEETKPVGMAIAAMPFSLVMLWFVGVQWLNESAAPKGDHVQPVPIEVPARSKQN